MVARWVVLSQPRGGLMTAEELEVLDRRRRSDVAVGRSSSGHLEPSERSEIPLAQIVAVILLPGAPTSGASPARRMTASNTQP